MQLTYLKTNESFIFAEIKDGHLDLNATVV